MKRNSSSTMFPEKTYCCESETTHGGNGDCAKFKVCCVRTLLLPSVLVLLTLTPLTASTDTMTSSYTQKLVNVSGDFILGAIFPIHQRGTGFEACGEIQV